jgi:hypothetical protein
MFPVRYELGFYIPEDGILHSHRRERNKSCIHIRNFQGMLIIQHNPHCSKIGVISRVRWFHSSYHLIVPPVLTFQHITFYCILLLVPSRLKFACNVRLYSGGLLELTV